MFTFKLILIALFSFSTGTAFFSFISKNWYFIRFCLLYSAIFLAGQFLGNKYVIFLIYASFCLYISKKQPENILYYYVVLLSAFPVGISWTISLPGINSLFAVNQSRILVLFLFLPIFIRIISSEGRMFDSSSSYTGKIDRLLFAYLVLVIVLSLRDTNFTSFFRGMAYKVVDIWIPYFVISRTIKNVNTVLVVFLFTAVVISIMAFLETTFSFRIYDRMSVAMGEFAPLFRDVRGGSLRVYASMGSPLTLGFFLSLAFVLAVRVRSLIKCPIYTPWILTILVVLGIDATGSRSPIFTCIFGVCIVIWWSMGRQVVQKTAWLVLVVFIVFFYWLFAYGIDWLVSFDEAGMQGNFYYRYELLLNSSDAIKNNLIFGSTDFWENEMLEKSRQGQGIIDITNTYLGVILAYGVVGLSLFLAVWFVALKGLYSVHAPDNLASVLMGTFVTMVLMMFITSPVWSVPNYYYFFLAVVSGFLKLHDNRFLVGGRN